MFTGQLVATSELALQTQRIHDSSHAIQAATSILRIVLAQTGDGANGLRNGLRLTDTTGLNHDIIKALHLHDLKDLLNQIRPKRATNTTILKSHQALIFFADNASLLDQIRINIDLANVIDDYRKLNASLVGENMFDQCCFPTAQITGQEQYRSLFCIHLFTLL